MIEYFNYKVSVRFYRAYLSNVSDTIIIRIRSVQLTLSEHIRIAGKTKEQFVFKERHYSIGHQITRISDHHIEHQFNNIINPLTSRILSSVTRKRQGCIIIYMTPPTDILCCFQCVTHCLLLLTFVDFFNVKNNRFLYLLFSNL